MFPRRPYLVIPKLIEQPTWGGTYIPTAKQWSEKKGIVGKKFGQSYELFGKSKFRLDVTSTDDTSFIPEVGNPDNDRIAPLALIEGRQYCGLTTITAQPVPILIKLTQALGNSFQIHVKPGAVTDRWKPKPETWFYFEDGMATCGLAEGVNIDAYKKCCEEINSFMLILSKQVQEKQLSLSEGQSQAKTFIQEKNPWQYVNTIQIKKDEVVDMSAGGIHHSWEEDREKYPLGNVLYEIQLDAMDPVSTLRSFDQGKIKNDRSIRPIQVDEYFKFLDTDPGHNRTANIVSHPDGTLICKTPHYSLDRLKVSSPIKETTYNSFVHLFVKEGTVKVLATDGEVIVGTGHSCFIPQEVGEYSLENIGESCTVLKTYI